MMGSLENFLLCKVCLAPQSLRSPDLCCSGVSCSEFSKYRLWAASCRSYFLSQESSSTAERKPAPAWNCSQQGLRIILSSWVMIFGERPCLEFFKMYFFGALNTTSWVPFSPMIVKGRQTSLQLKSPKLCNPHQNYLINSSTDQREICIFDFWVNCPLQRSCHSLATYSSIWLA